MLGIDLIRYKDIPLSKISSHAEPCCFATLTALLARIDSNDPAEELAVIPEIIKWGPVVWPVYWCQLTDDGDEFHGDCGVHASLAHMVLRRRGIVSTQVQIAIESRPEMVEHWRATWLAKGIRPDWWIGESTVYHEVIWTNDRFWDSSEGRWFSGVDDHLLAGRVVAIRMPTQVWSYDSNRS